MTYPIFTGPYTPLNERDIEIVEEGDLFYYDGPIVEFKVMRYKNSIVPSGSEGLDGRFRYELTYVAEPKNVDEQNRMAIRWTKKDLLDMLQSIEKAEKAYEQEEH